MKKSILIIEDNEQLRDLYCESLQELELDIHVAGDGIDAYKKIAQNTYDLYIVDIFLPGITGLEVIKVIKERYEKAKQM
jgi:CheY-like chemotaxis protein